MTNLAVPTLFREKGGRKGVVPATCALVVDPPQALPVWTVRLSWSDLLAARLREVARQAAISNLPEGKMLPYASLRAALEAQIPEAVLLVADLGAPWNREECHPFLSIPGGSLDLTKRAASALKTWMSMVLKPWSDRVGIDDDLFTAVADLATPEAAFTVDELEFDLAQRLHAGESFDKLKHGVLQVIARCLEGQELFEGLGPVYRIIRASSANNTLRFQTWPAVANGGRYSMVAELTVESTPFLSRPVVVVRAARRLWYDTLPDAKKLGRLRTVTGTVIGENKSPVAIEFTTSVRKGVPDEPFSPEFMLQALNLRLDLGKNLEEWVAQQGRQGVFVGIPYSPQLGGSHPVGRGTTTRDNADLLNTVLRLMAADGFKALPFQETAETKRTPRRAEDHHKALQAEALIADIALTLGRNRLDGDALMTACRQLMSDGEVPEITVESALDARSALEIVRESNRQRMRRAFGDQIPTVALVARTEAERAVLRAVITGLFGTSVAMVEYLLPADVHGPRADMPAPAHKAKERFAARVAAWRPLAEAIFSDYPGAHALVQAADWYDRRKDDPVNKLAGRYALASIADANVQYLLPPASNWKGLKNYLHRVQAAVYDLLFGHSGLVSEVQSLLKGAFPKEDTRPKAIIGISVVTQARLRSGAKGGRICLATRIDAATGRTTARVGWFDGCMRWTDYWEPFFAALKRVASPDVTASLGSGRNVERDSFQKFVRAVIDDTAQAGDRPLVLIDSTSAASLWPWLQDSEFGSTIALGAERLGMATCWPGVRLVRVRTDHAGRIFEHKSTSYEQIDPATNLPTGEAVERYAPSITERIIRIAEEIGGEAVHYWITAGYFQMSIPRGLSVYRNLTSFYPAKKVKGLNLPPSTPSKGLYVQQVYDIAKELYRLPRPVDITVVTHCDGDSTDRIAHMVASLRCGYGHSPLPTTLPSPLSFESKVRDYMTRFGLEEADAESDDAVSDEQNGHGASIVLADGYEDDLGPAELSGPAVTVANNEAESCPDEAPDLDLELTDRWTAAARRFGIQGPGRSALTNSTSLRAIGTNQFALPHVGMPSIAATQSKDIGGDVMASTAINADVADLWPNTPKTPVLPVPNFVTADWLRTKISAPQSLLRHIHHWAEEIRCLSGFPWPDERPTAEQFPDILLDGLRYPAFVRAVTRVAARHMKLKKRKDFMLFGPYRKVYQSHIQIASTRAKCPRPADLGPAIALLAGDQQFDVMRGTIYLMTFGRGYDETLHAFLREYPEQLGILEPFMTAAEAHLNDHNFNWDRDIIEQPNAPLVSPNGSTTSFDEDEEDEESGEDEGLEGEIEGPASANADAEPLMAAEGAQVSLTIWRDTLAEAHRMLTTIRAKKPIEEALIDLIAVLEQAREAARLWQECQPRGILAAPFWDAAQALAADFAAIVTDDKAEQETHASLNWPQSLEQVDQTTAARANAELEYLSDMRREAVEIRKKALDLIAEIAASGAMARLAEAMPMTNRAIQLAEEGLARLQALMSVLQLGRIAEGPNTIVVTKARTGNVDTAAWEVTDPSTQAVSAFATAQESSLADETGADSDTSGPSDQIERLGVAFDPAQEDIAVTPQGEEEPLTWPEPEHVSAEIQPAPLPDEALTGLAASIELKMLALIENHEFGLAYHLLRAAIRIFGEYRFAFSEAELRLAAMAPHINHSLLQGDAALNSLIEDVLLSIQEMQEDETVADDVSSARMLTVFGALTTVALFHTDSMAIQALETLNGLEAGVGEGVYKLKDALVSRSGLGVTPAMLKTVSQAAEDVSYGEECLQQILNSIESFSALRFRFVLGNKIRQSLVHSNGVIGKLRDGLKKGGAIALEVTREFTKYMDRQQIIYLLDEAEEAATHFKAQGVDGDARERLVAHISDLAAQCREYVQVRDAIPEMRKSGQRAIVDRIRLNIIGALEPAEDTLKAFMESAPPLPLSAARYALQMLARLRDAISGLLPSSGISDHLLALHGPLLWLPGLEFGRSWLPSPYQPEMVVNTLLNRTPLPREINGDRYAAMETAVRQHLNADCFVAARLLVDGGAFYGITDVQRGELRDLIEGNAKFRRDKLTGDIAEVRRMVDRVQRMNVLPGVDAAQAQLSQLDRIEPNELPTNLTVDARNEKEENEVILDFAAAENLLCSVREEIQHLLRKPRQNLLGRLDTLSSEHGINPTDAERVQGLITKDDLLTAGEYIDFLESGRALPETTSPNPRFRAFFPAVPNTLMEATTLSEKVADKAQACLQEEIDFGPLAYSRLSESRRADALALLNDWKGLRHRVNGGHNTDQVLALLNVFLDRAGLKGEIVRPDRALTSNSRKIYVSEMRLQIPWEPDCLLLPDFGSQTKGNYRVCVVTQVPSDTEISQFCTNAGSMGVLILVLSVASAGRLAQIATYANSKGQRVLVIDEGMFLFALSEPEFRPLTLLECAQPFSFASPYRDYGNQAVPKEIFFGRRTEYRKLLDASGSCIVYGGRRLGKTALLQYLKESEHKPKEGMAVAYVSILDIGNNVMPSCLWEYISRELPDLFYEPVHTATEFSQAINDWLEADTKRRILVLLDEADRFIKTDADGGFKEFIRLQQLMDSSHRRFKFVLAGLHNVTRLVHTENPPLKQIASDPQRIGPLMDDELHDAEQLVTRPLAAMGYEFENREDVWRILSHCNYYPVLVQLFCKGLLEGLNDRKTERGKWLQKRISSDQVREALEDERIAREIAKMFNYTIQIEERYALIANIMALRAFDDSAMGRVGEGMSAVEVLASATKHWPKAFNQVNRLSVVEDLLDEMEGLGVLRRVSHDAWALRSHTILRLLGSQLDVVTKLVDFLDRPAPEAFEPRSMRRPLHLPAIFKVAAKHACPLTMGQEHDLLTRDANSAAVPIRVIFGNSLSDQGIVAAAMKTAGPLVSDGSRIEVVSQVWTNCSQLMEAITKARPREIDLTLLVIDSKSPWDFSWLEMALRTGTVREGRVRLAFIGGPTHALSWIQDPRAHPVPTQIRVLPLQLWSAAMLDYSLKAEHLAVEQFQDGLREKTGGFNRLLSQLLIINTEGSREKFSTRIDRQFERLIADKDQLWNDLGLLPQIKEVFLILPRWVGDDGRISAYYIDEGILPEVPEAAGLSGQQIVEYGLLMGLLEADPGVTGSSADTQPYLLNPLLKAAAAVERGE